MLNAHVVFATITGNNEMVADVITDILNDSGVHTVESDISQTDPTEFKDADICVVCSYSYENGDLHLPMDGVDFYHDLMTLDLSKQIYGVAGSGDTFYKKYFNIAVDKFNRAFMKTHAKHGADNVKINLTPDEKDVKQLSRFTKQLITSATQK